MPRTGQVTAAMISRKNYRLHNWSTKLRAWTNQKKKFIWSTSTLAWNKSDSFTGKKNLKNQKWPKF